MSEFLCNDQRCISEQYIKSEEFGGVFRQLLKTKHGNAYNLICIGQEVVSSADNAIEWCQKHHLIPKTRECGNCKQPMTIRTDRGIGSFRCQRRNCTNTTQQAIVRGTWFEGVETKLMIAKGLLLMYSFATGLSYEQAIYTSANTDISSWLGL